GNTSSATKTIVVSLPDLQVTQSDMSITPGAARPGQNLTISVGVENNGSRSIHGAIIVFLIDGEAIGSEALDISSHSTATAEISWTAVEGDHELVIEVDSGETIIEISEQNNRATFHFNVAGGQSGPLLLDPDIGIIALLVGVIAVIVCMVIVLRLKGKSGKR
ncbi:MAG: hypothetical protein LUQ55_00920, partial [Methanomassiliicoccales archaeon]|nr:hypothetical protein [Methanomassiliicoccales archaeon]